MSQPIAVVAITLPPAAMARVAAVAEVRQLTRPFTREQLIEAIADADGLLTSNQVMIDNALMDSAPCLRVISNFGVGYNNVDPDEAAKRGIAVCNTPGVLNDAVADLAMLLILSAARRMGECTSFVSNGSWCEGKPIPPLGFDLASKTLGIVGYGRIGRAIAVRARAFGMRVVFNDLYEKDHDVPPVPYVPLPMLLRSSDIVSLNVNLTPQSYHLIGEKELALMKPTAWILNTSRGPVIDQAALAKALHAGTIAGAALDVLEVEPPPGDDPILTAPNTIIVPHVGSATSEARAAMLELAVDNFIACLKREAPIACVNAATLVLKP